MHCGSNAVPEQDVTFLHWGNARLTYAMSVAMLVKEVSVLHLAKVLHILYAGSQGGRIH